MNIGPILRAMKHNRTRVVLVVVEIAMTLAIVTNCINVILAERTKMSRPSGFADDNLLALRVRPFSAEFRDPAFLDNSIDADVRTIAGIPGVQAVANTNVQLWEGGGSSTQVAAIDHNSRDIETERTQTYYGTKDLIQTLGAKLVEGRTFRDGDYGVGHQDDPASVTIISKTLADALFPDGHAVGKTIQNARRNGDLIGNPMTVVGVIETFYNPFGIGNGDRSAVAERVMLLPARVGGTQRGISYLIRTDPGAMSSVMEQVEKRLTAANAGRIFDFLRMDEKKGRWFSSSKIVVTTMTCIIVALVAVTALGLLGLTSLSVTERRKQIGTRRALGATRGDILRDFLIENWIVTTAGLVFGVAGAYALNFLLVSHVSEVKMHWQLIVAGMILLWINGLAATVPPALRAMAVSPSVATRSV